MNQANSRLDDLRIDRGSAPERKGGGWFIVLAILLIGVAGGLGWKFMGGRATVVQTIAAKEAVGGGSARTVLNASGYVTARRAATVSSKITGKVVEVLVEEGMRVAEGQVLARLDDSNVATSMRSAEARLAASQAGLNETKVRIREAERELKRQSDLIQSKIATVADYERAEAEALALKARLEQQQASVTVEERDVASWKQQLEDTVIRAPFAGVVTIKNAQPGEMISPISAGGGFTRTGICTIVDMDSLEVEIDVNESYINRVEIGQAVEATLDAYPEWKIPCKVIAIIPTADRQKATVRVRVGFDALDKRILPEMSVKVAFRMAASSATQAGPGERSAVVPTAALRKEDGRDIVWVVRNGAAERRAVSVVSRGMDEVTLGGGLAVGEKVVVGGSADLKEGMALKESR